MGERLSTKRARPRFRFALPGYPTLTVGLPGDPSVVPTLVTSPPNPDKTK
jgi:hypothetical protein